MKQLKWVLIFGSIVLLTQSSLFINYAIQPSFLGFPQWIWFFIGFHLLFVLALFLFVNEPEES